MGYYVGINLTEENHQRYRNNRRHLIGTPCPLILIELHIGDFAEENSDKSQPYKEGIFIKIS
jgi:hypothetical protein